MCLQPFYNCEPKLRLYSRCTRICEKKTFIFLGSPIVHANSLSVGKEFQRGNWICPLQLRQKDQAVHIGIIEEHW